jgi:hypothetical protein
MEISKDKEIIDIYKLMVIPRVMVMILWLISMADFVQFGILKLGRFDCVNTPPQVGAWRSVMPNLHRK